MKPFSEKKSLFESFNTLWPAGFASHFRVWVFRLTLTGKFLTPGKRGFETSPASFAGFA